MRILRLPTAECYSIIDMIKTYAVCVVSKTSYLYKVGYFFKVSTFFDMKGFIVLCKNVATYFVCPSGHSGN